MWRLRTKYSPLPEQEGFFFESDCGPLFYKIYGKKGPWMILVHGIGSSHYCWRHIIPEFENTHRVLAIDLWGFGSSSKELNLPMNLDNQVEQIKKLIQYLHIKNYYYVGHSLGGAIGLWLSIKDNNMKKCIAITPAAHPRLVSKFIEKMKWLARWTPLWINKNLIRRLLFKLIKDKSLISEDMVDNYFKPYLEPKAHLSFVAALNIIQDKRIFDHLHEVPKGTVMLWGQKDQVIPLKIARLIQKKTPQAEHFTHPTSGHLPTEEDYQWVISHLKAQVK